jgi:glycosyltransferase involved in cell wall biosynthesis
MVISFVIPIYKTEKYIKECVNSIISQAGQDIEVILVDDGSPDGCPEICDEYAKNDRRISVVHKENGGLSSARNAGLAVAKGKYVTFVDSDDVIFSNSLPKIVSWAKKSNADICFLHAYKLFSDGSINDLGESLDGGKLRGKGREDAIGHLTSRPKYPGSAWSKLFRREFLIDNDLHFPYDRRYSEDVGFIRDCILNAKDFDYLEIPFYKYRQGREGSITNKVSSKNFFDLFMFVTESVDKLTIDQQPVDDVAKICMALVAYEYSILAYLYVHIPKQDRKKALSMLKRYKWVLKYAVTVKSKVIFIVSGLLGIRLTSLLINGIKKINRK